MFVNYEAETKQVQLLSSLTIPLQKFGLQKKKKKTKTKTKKNHKTRHVFKLVGNYSFAVYRTNNSIFNVIATYGVRHKIIIHKSYFRFIS